MAFPVFKSATTYTADSTGTSVHTVTLPAADFGDLLIILWRSTSTSASHSTSGWTTVKKTVSGVVWHLTYKISDGTETTVDLNSSNDTTRQAIVAACVSLPGALEYAWEVAAQADLTLPFSPEVSPNYGTDDVLWLVWGYAGNTGNLLTGPPSGFENFTLANNPQTNSDTRRQMGFGSRELQVSSLEPGAWAGDATLFSAPVGVTVAIRGTASATYGIRISDIKEPNIANELVTGVTNARVKVWIGTNDSGEEYEILSNQVIENGVLEVNVSEEDGFTLNDTVTVEVMWTVGTERNLFITETTVVDLESGS